MSSKTIITCGTLFILITATAIYFTINYYSASINHPPTATSTISAVVYTNSDYGFKFALPESWQGYSIVTNEWEGYSLVSQSDTPSEHGPLISIRHPAWKAESPRQDIPIMVLTLKQWAGLQQEQFHIGAAPIGPSELGRNTTYVFALPARYNFAFLTGFEEVDQLLKNDSLHAFNLN